MCGTQRSLTGHKPAMHCHPLRAGYRAILCLALLAIIACVPVHAADPGQSVADSIFPINQAHLAWMAEVSDVEMVAAISYIETLYGADTGTLTSLHANFTKAKSAIGSVTTMPALASHTNLMQKTAVSFNRETMNQTNAYQGKSRDLQAQIGRAVNANPYIKMKRDAYWATRSTHQLAAFDTWVTQTQNTLNTLQAQGFPVSATQPYLTRFASLKPDLKSSLDTNDPEQADSTALQIRVRSLEIADRVQALQGAVSGDKSAEFRIDEADRVIARADRLNRQLIEQILDIGAAEPALSQLRTDAKLARGALNGGQMGLVATQLVLIKKDYRDLASAYRDIAVSASLPEGMADILKSTSITLEETADRIGES
jgi:hypothetical protein